MANQIANLAFYRLAAAGITAGNPVTIIHGILGSKMNWRTMAKKLTNELQRNVVVVDVRNHGDSPHLPTMSYELMSDDLVQLFQSQNINSSILIGHSMGGKIGMTLALRYPELVERLVVLDVAPVKGTSNIMQYIKLLKLLHLDSVTNRREASKILQPTIPDSVVRGFLLTNLVRDQNTGRHRWACNLDAIEANINSLQDFPTLSEQYHGPTLFLGGSNSSYIRSEVYPDIKQLFPKAVIDFIEGAGHWIHYDKPLELLKRLKEFITS